MPYCAVLECKNSSRFKNLNNGGISYHRFPKDPDLKLKWIKATARQNWMPSKTSSICSAHFEENDFCPKKSGNKYLIEGAVPSRRVAYFFNKYTPSSSDEEVNSAERRKRKLSKSTSNSEDIEEQGNQEQEVSMASSIDSDASASNEKRREQIAKVLAVKKRRRRKVERTSQEQEPTKIVLFTMDDIMNDLEEKFFFKLEDLTILKATNLRVEDLRNVSENETEGDIDQLESLRLFALTLHYFSLEAYNYVRDTYYTCLPHVRKLTKWYSSVNGEPGFTVESFAALKLKARTKNHQIIAGLVVDEMSIHRGSDVDETKIRGYLDIGIGLDGDYLPEAREALIFLVTGINSNFKVPVAYFLVDAMTGAQQAELVKQCLIRIHETGVKIVSITIDGYSTSLSMMRHLGCDLLTGKHIFKHPVTKHEVVAVADPGNLIKFIGFTLQEYGTFIDADGNKIEWTYLEELKKLQKKEKSSLADNLRHRHHRFYDRNVKMNVEQELFSLYVADAIDFCREDLNLLQFQESLPTTKFLRMINTLFDIFDSRTPEQGFKKAINKHNAAEIIAYLDEAIEYLSNLKSDKGILFTKSQRKMGLMSFIGCAMAIKHFHKTLIKTREISCFPFYKISQDQLELFFHVIKSHSRYLVYNDPPASQFIAAYRKLLMHIKPKNRGNGNRAALERLSILKCSSPIERMNLTTRSVVKACWTSEVGNKKKDDEEIVALFKCTDSYLHVVHRIALNIVLMLMKKIQCDVCVGALISKTTNPRKFCVTKDISGFIHPSNDVIRICKNAESIMRPHPNRLAKKGNQKIVTKVLGHFVGTKLFDDIVFHQNEFPTANHIADLIEAVAEKYIEIRTSWYD